ncbi:uncharacterized protein LOC134532190 isoform X2 [Bacillus rossius redtenbacheri]|uniref:uncharacterized protein LOC134532190 isoform X2 n=1 Tax=Bacillus rossius redtenbacheri TaxID=93214 RepID=UPI002FDE7B18
MWVNINNENHVKKELDRRRNLRLVQVRQQSKDIARKVRQKTEEERSRQLSLLEKERLGQQQRRKAQELAYLQKKYQRCLHEIGTSHDIAAAEPDAGAVLEARRREDARTAAERSRTALERLQRQQRAERKRAQLGSLRQQYLRAVEEFRASLVQSADVRRKDKQPLAEVSLNIQPTAEASRVMALGPGPAPCSCATARLCDCLDEPSCSSLFALDSRVSLVPPEVTGSHLTAPPPPTNSIGGVLEPPSSRPADPVTARNQDRTTVESSELSSSRHAKMTTAGSSGQHSTDHKVQFYDYTSRFEKTAEARYTVRRHDPSEEGRGSAVAAAQREADCRLGQAAREELCCRQQERCRLALARERLRGDYQHLLQQLPALAHLEATRPPVKVHLADDRRKHKDAVRQSNMASVFEKLHHAFIELDKPPTPSPRGVSVTASPRHSDDETPPKLNVGVCADSREGGLEAALETLRARLEQQRALLRSHAVHQPASSEQNMSRKVGQQGRVMTLPEEDGQANKQSVSSNENYIKFQVDSRSKGKIQEIIQGSSKSENQDYKQKCSSKDRKKEGKHEGRSKITNIEGTSKDRNQGIKREGRSKDTKQACKQESSLKHILESKCDKRLRERNLEGLSEDELGDKNKESRHEGTRKERNRRIKRVISKEKEHKDGQSGRLRDGEREDWQKRESTLEDRYRESSEGSEVTVVGEYSLDVSTSKRAEVATNSASSSEKSSSNSLCVYEDMKLKLNVKEVVRSPVRAGHRPQRWKHVCKNSVNVRRCRKKLSMVEEGTQTITDLGEGVEGMVMESSGSTAYLSPPQHLSSEQTEAIDQLLHAVGHHREQVEDLIAEGGRENNPVLMLYIARLLSMSRASVENLSVVSSPTPQNTRCDCLGCNVDQNEHEQAAPSQPPPVACPQTTLPVSHPDMNTCTQSYTSDTYLQCSQGFASHTNPRVNLHSSSSSNNAFCPEGSLHPSCAGSHTHVTSTICEPKMYSMPFDKFTDSLIFPQGIGTPVSFPVQESFEARNYEENCESSLQNHYFSTSLLDIPLGTDYTKHSSADRSKFENSMERGHTISSQCAKISNISAQIESVREEHKLLESSNLNHDITTVCSPVFVPTPHSPMGTSMMEPSPNTWRAALAGEVATQQQDRQPRQKPPSALDRNRLLARCWCVQE